MHGTGVVRTMFDGDSGGAWQCVAVHPCARVLAAQGSPVPCHTESKLATNCRASSMVRGCSSAPRPRCAWPTQAPTALDLRRKGRGGEAR